MKKRITTLLILFLALLVFYGGAGVNFVSYCCDHCEEEGVEALMQSDCCEIHGHEHQLASAEGVICHVDPSMNCSVKRIHFDWEKIHTSLPELQPAVFELDYLHALNLSLIPLPVLQDYTHLMPEGIPISIPRSYLSILTVLLI